MPSITAPITAQAVVYVCLIDVFVSVNGWDRIAVLSSAPAAAQAMDNVKKTDVSAKRGKYTGTCFHCVSCQSIYFSIMQL